MSSSLRLHCDGKARLFLPEGWSFKNATESEKEGNSFQSFQPRIVKIVSVLCGLTMTRKICPLSLLRFHVSKIIWSF